LIEKCLKNSYIIIQLIKIALPKKAKKMDEIKNEEILNHPEDYLRKGR
jgi:hypothetical protein